MSELPVGWEWTTLGRVVSIRNGFAFKSTDFCKEGIPVVRQSNLTGSVVDLIDCVYVPSAVANAASDYVIKQGDILLGMSGSIGEPSIYQYDFDAVQNQRTGLIRFYVEDDGHRSFIRHALVLFEQQYTDRGKGIGVQNVSAKDIEQTQVPLPPLPEQRLIVAKIDSLSAKSRRARDQLDHIPRLVENYKQAILAAAFRGQLTAVSDSDWTKCSLADVCDPLRPITYGVIKLGSETPDGVPCLRTSNVRWLRIDTEGMKRIASALSAEYARTVLRGDEVLVNVRGTLGGVAVAEPRMAGWNVSREVAVAPVDPAAVDPHYAAYWIGADTSQRWLNRVEKGIAYTGINLEDLRKLPIEFPSVAKQREIVRRIETSFAWIDRLASEATSARKLIDRLDQTILAKAFRGELVPQDPNDEPASILLERIRTERAAVPVRAKPAKGASRTRRQGKPRR